jgi:hypothetical protein
MAVFSKKPARYFFVALALGTALWNPMSARGQQTDPCPDMAPPAGAKSSGYTYKVFCLAPTTADIAVTDAVPSKLYSGHWFDRLSYPMTMFSSGAQGLVLASGAVVTTETRKSLPGLMPLLPASAGFYVEFAERISDNDPDHWPAVWLMPQEHNVHQADHAPGDPPRFERWLELDVDEGGFNKSGHHGAMLSWSGIFPHYERQFAANDPVSSPPMDRTQEHIFGLSYDPVRTTVTWYVDGVSVGSASTAGLPAIIKEHHYYLIMSNQTHGLHRPYNMYIRYFTAWAAGPVPNPPSGVHTVTSP